MGLALDLEAESSTLSSSEDCVIENNSHVILKTAGEGVGKGDMVLI